MGTNDNIIVGTKYERSIHSSLGELLLLVLRMHNDKVLQVDAVTGEKLPANLLLNRAVLLAKWLQKNNIGPGDSISMSSENCLEYCIVPIAAFLAGATFAPLNPDYTIGELKHVVNLSKPKLIVCSPKTVQQIVSGRVNYPYVRSIILLGKNRVQHDFVMFEDIIQGAKSDSIDEEFEAIPVNPDENVAVIFCSSGTTGLPKGVMTTHYNITSYVEIVSEILERNMGLTSETMPEVMTGVAPFFHGMGFMLMLLTILGGSTLVVYPKFDPKQFLQSIAKHQVTTLVVPPPIVLFMVKHPMVKNYDLSSIREVKSGAAPMGKELEREVTGKLNLKYVSQNYGMTETTLGVLMLQAKKGYKLGSVGCIVPGMKVKIIDKNGNALGANQNGELCFQGPLIMKGYVDNPEATASTIDTDNWLHTGDIGYYDDDGFFFIVDRIKELIKYKGFQVAPAELEALLMTHPAVADAAVVGVDDESVGELPLAFVVKKPTENVSGVELEKYVAERVSSAKQLRGGVHFITAIPRNPSGKILRRILRENAKKLRSKL